MTSGLLWVGGWISRTAADLKRAPQTLSAFALSLSLFSLSAASFSFPLRAFFFFFSVPLRAYTGASE